MICGRTQHGRGPMRVWNLGPPTEDTIRSDVLVRRLIDSLAEYIGTRRRGVVDCTESCYWQRAFVVM